MRVQLEGHAALRAAERLTPAQREQLEALVAEIDAREGSGDADALMRLDAEIHRFVYALRRPTPTCRRRSSAT